ncbi:MAG TPA: sigma-70 family RNA polymerase sigma factor [Actinomycetes bacterium]|nr:sigma-70 family RNA polymerase sigma factor [Actinomycetes bacterium]
MNRASDEELLAAHLHGDRAAFGQLVARHERRVYGLCLRVLGSREDAEDATQETFLAVLRRAASFRGEAAFSTWLFRIAVNAATDQARRRGRARAVPLETEELAAAAPSGSDPSGAVPDALAVQAALCRVPEDFRATLVLCDLYGFPHAQAAEILQIPVGTVKSRLFRARLALGEQLAAGEARPPGPGRRARPSPGMVKEPGTQAVVGASEPAEPELRSKEE